MAKRPFAHRVPLLALDDTDTRDAGCTTRTAFRIACAVDAAGGALAEWGLTAPARLVRLNPAAPHRTRGNGALVLPMGPVDKSDAGRAVGVTERGDALCAFGATHAEVDEGAVRALRRIVQAHLPAPADGDGDPQPAAILVRDACDRTLYETAVQRMVTADTTWATAPPDTLRLTPDGRRGEIGALAAAAWPMERFTWEAIGYREDDARTPERDLPPGFLQTVLGVAGGFDNHDAATGRIRCVPRTPCPVRFGVRGTDPHALVGLLLTQAGEGAGGWLVQTNHATADHARHAGATLRAHAIVRLEVDLVDAPRRTPGGHVFVAALAEHGSALTLAAYEPTKGLRDVLFAAVRGDRLEVLGRTSEDATQVALEALRVVDVAPRVVRGVNPRCPSCGRATHSVGAGAGYRCRPCGVRVPATARVDVAAPAPLAVGDVHQVPDHVRGHLLPPLGGLPAVRGWDGAPGAPIAPVFSAPALAPLAP